MADAMDEGALLVLEWPEYLAPGLREENRLDIELRPVSGGGQGENLDIPGQSCEMKRSAVITAHGAAGAALLEALRPCCHRASPCAGHEPYPVFPEGRKFSGDQTTCGFWCRNSAAPPLPIWNA